MGVVDTSTKRMSLEDMFQCTQGGGLKQLAGVPPMIASPADDGIKPGGGDDESAPNATVGARLNRIVCIAMANVGYSTAAKDKDIKPTGLAYDAVVSEGAKGSDLTLKIILTYGSSFPKEGMVVWLKKRQQMINEEKLSELLLIETAFEDWTNGKWVPITTDVRYTEEANAVVQAVITSDSGQTAGRVKAEGSIEDAKLGPVGERGRIVLTYYCEVLYSYAQMSLTNADRLASARKLVPLAIQLPWAPCDSPATNCEVTVRVRGPDGSQLLDPQEHILAYRDLGSSLAKEMWPAGGRSRQSVIVPAQPSAPDPMWQFASSSLPPRPTLILTWLSLSEPADHGWEYIPSTIASDMPTPASSKTKVTLLEPAAEDAALMRAALPGNQIGHLFRCRVETGPATRRQNVIRIHTDISISDASGSTGMTLKGSLGAACGGTVRAGFNKLEERRLLSRLKAVPQLQAAGLLLPQDIWRQQIIIFDHVARSTFHLDSKVSDLDCPTVTLLVQALEGDSAKAAELKRSNGSLLQSWQSFFEKLRSIKPGGSTSFVAGADGANNLYKSPCRFVLAGSKIEYTTYINFDTDGGNNCGPCYEAIKRLMGTTQAVQGHVLGLGAWVDQDCATKVAKIMRGSASLAVEFPDDLASDILLRQDLSRWIRVLRTSPISLTISAGAVAWQARHGMRSENVVDCLLARGPEDLKFDMPDITEMEYTKAQVKGLQAGEVVELLFLSRVPIVELKSSLTVEVLGEDGKAAVFLDAETLNGVPLGHAWLSAIAGSGGVTWRENSAVLCPRLKYRIEDDLSFAWNLPSKSGSTASLGRARTQHRPAVTPEQQPDEPLLNSNTMTPIASCNDYSYSEDVEVKKCRPRQLQAVSRSASKTLISQAFGCSTEIKRAMCDGSGSPVKALLSGTSAQQRDRERDREREVSHKSLESCAAPRRGKLIVESKGDDDNSSFVGPMGPVALLLQSGFMRGGPADTAASDGQSLKRALNALKHLAVGLEVPANQRLKKMDGEPEDPLVGVLLGSGPISVSGSNHWNYVCDACSKGSYILGVRFKACSAADLDVCETCRISGRFAGGSGFVAVPQASIALASALAALAEWWVLQPWTNAPPCLESLLGAGVGLGGRVAAERVRSLEVSALGAFAKDLGSNA